MSAAPSNLATSFSARWDCRAAARPRPAHGRHRRRCSTSSPKQGHEFPKKILEWRQVSKLKSTYTDALPNYRAPADPSRAHHLRAGRDHHRAAVVERTEPAEHSGTHRRRPKNPPRLYRDARPQAGVGRLFADRAAAAGRDRRHPGAEAGVPRWARHSRHDGVGNVRRADQGHAGRGAPPREGDQFRHHLRHLGVWPGQPARHRRARKRPPISRNISSAFPASAPTWTIQRVLPQARLCRDAVRPQVPLPGYQGDATPRSAPSTNARRSTPACRAPPPTSSAAP